MGRNTQNIVHSFLTVSFSLQNGMISSDTRLQEFVWFEEPVRNPKQQLHENFFGDPSSSRLEEFVWFNEPFRNPKQRVYKNSFGAPSSALELNKNQSIDKENRFGGKMDDESFAEYFFANKWK